MRTVDRCEAKVKSKKAKIVGFEICALLIALSVTATAQQATKVPRIGYLAVPPPAVMSARLEAFHQGLHELGYEEGKNIAIESRYAEGQLDRLPRLAAELVRLRVDVILSSGPSVTRPAKEATNKIPIVMAQDDDPVASGFVVSLAHPGGNITGLSTHYPEISAKQLELLKEIVPQLSRLVILGTSRNPGTQKALKETEQAAAAFKITVQYLDVEKQRDLEPAFRSASRWRAEALLTLGGPVLNSARKSVVDLAVKHRLPAAYNVPEFVEAGGLMNYGVNFIELYRRSAYYVDKILKGTKPADLPVEQPTKFELVINLKAAKHIGLTIPPNVLARADKVIR